MQTYCGYVCKYDILRPFLKYNICLILFLFLCVCCAVYFVLCVCVCVRARTRVCMCMLKGLRYIFDCVLANNSITRHSIWISLKLHYSIHPFQGVGRQHRYPSSSSTLMPKIGNTATSSAHSHGELLQPALLVSFARREVGSLETWLGIRLV